MRHRALNVAQMDPGDFGMDYYYLANADGEVQVFDDYRARRSAAAQARREVLANGPVSHDPQLQYERIAARREAILARARSLRSAE